MAEKILSWESRLWSHISSSDGKHCPFYSHCYVRQSGGWCFDDNKESIDRVADCKRFRTTDYDFIGRVESCKVYEMVETLANRCLKKGKILYPPVPTGLISLADEENPIEVRLVPLRFYHGAIWHLREGWIIQLKRDDTMATQRFTLFHEAFHILAHRKSAFVVFSKRGANEGAFNETLANAFAACVLTPDNLVREKWVEVKNLSRMARIFQVPKSAMCIRLKVLGLI